jgi:hypothetical protein
LFVVVIAIVAAAAMSVGVLSSSAADAPLAAGSFTLTGNVQTPLEMSVADLAALPTQRTVTVTFTAGGTPETHTFTGPRLRDVLALAGPKFDAAIKNDKLRYYASVTASDGYQALVGDGEFDASFENKDILLAVTQDAASLARQGPRLVVPGDIAGGRYVSGVTSVVFHKPSSAILEATTPLQASITSFASALAVKSSALIAANTELAATKTELATTKTALAAANGALAAANGALATANTDLTATKGAHASANTRVAALTAQLRELKLSIAKTPKSPLRLAKDGLALTVSGPPSRALHVRVLIPAVVAQKDHLPSRVISSADVTTTADGTAALVMRVTAPAGTALPRHKGKLDGLAEATTADRRSQDSATIGG